MVVESLKDVNLWLNMVVYDILPKEYEPFIENKAKQNIDFLIRALIAMTGKIEFDAKYSMNKIRGVLSISDNTIRMVKYTNSHIKKERHFEASPFMKRDNDIIETLLLNIDFQSEHYLSKVVELSYTVMDDSSGGILSKYLSSTLTFDYTELLHIIVSVIREKVFEENTGKTVKDTTIHYDAIMKQMRIIAQYNPSVDDSDIEVPEKDDILRNIKGIRGKTFNIHSLLKRGHEKGFEEVLSSKYLLTKQVHRYLWMALKSADLECMYEGGVMITLFREMEKRVQNLQHADYIIIKSERLKRYSLLLYK